jgi:hypothetical protein
MTPPILAFLRSANQKGPKFLRTKVKLTYYVMTQVVEGGAQYTQN